MPFDYMHSDVPKRFSQAPNKARAMYREELLQRAKLLHRLGMAQEVTLHRLRTNLRWDWESNEQPAFVPELQAALPDMVAALYTR